MDSKSHAHLASGSLIFSLMAGYSIVYMDKNMISTAIIQIADQFGFKTGQTGAIMSAFFLGYTLTLIVSGWLADRFGAKPVLLCSMLLIGLFSFLFSFSSSLGFFILIRCLAGMGHGGYPPSCTKAVAENFPRERRTFVQALILSTSGIGGILASTLGAALIDRNWHVAYWVLGSLYLVAFVCILIFVPGDALPKRGSAQAQAQAQVSSDGAAAKSKVSVGQLMRTRNVLVLFLSMLLLNILLYGTMSWIPSYIKGTFKLTITQTGGLLAFNAIFTTVATIFAGKLLSKLFLGKEKMAIFGAATITALLMVAFLTSHNLWLSVVVMILISCVAVVAFTGIFTWPHKIMDPALIGSATGIINTGGTIGGFLAPIISGYLVEVAGGSFVWAFGFMALMGFLSGLAVLLVKVQKA
ncbi:MFS transporter [Bombiscardovia nodaiensis]|uniref:MFS transporter n=1 Tax=Bombiscardovia nodaiensis TaxID=2932181 RepID=A0ABM8B8U4_9BIFI|nr:MFS transporter [Bombiscardovia nodaiensis]